MKKRMKIMLICLAILFGSILVYKLFMHFMLNRFLAANMNPPVSVSTLKVSFQDWQSKLSATGSLRAIRGVNVTSEIAGNVQTIYFTPGAYVQKDAILAQLNAITDIARLHSLQANEELAQINYDRDKAQYEIHAVSKAALDTDAANLKSLKAQVAEQTSIVNKKTIKAPFAGRLGISAINPGQYVSPGDKVVTLQTLDPIFVDFTLPQQNIADIKMDQEVILTTDAYPKQSFSGKITTIDPLIDPVTRNIAIEATIHNTQLELLPGMFVHVEVITGLPKRYLTLPQTTITFNPYGNIVYGVLSKKDAEGKEVLTVQQIFVTTGPTRGDQVAVLGGLKEGDTVVSSGQLKLKNGSKIIVNNNFVPLSEAAPIVPDET